VIGRKRSTYPASKSLLSRQGRGVAQATKLLYLKRPALVQMIDSFVAKALGARLSPDGSVETRIRQTRAIIDHFRAAAVQLRTFLESVDEHLRGVWIERTLARILDALVWCSVAESWVARSRVLAGWRQESGEGGAS
jgi:hypothetical protein